MATSPHVIEVTDATFQTDVIERSRQTPVVVDFWAAWCGPCRTLGPILEETVATRDGEVVLAKIDVDANQQYAAQYGVRGIPAVKAFRDGELVDEFTGALPRPQVEAFLDRVVPSEADRLVSEARAAAPSDAAHAQELYRKALELDSSNRAAAIGLAELIAETEPEDALELVRPHRPDPAAEAVVTRAELAQAGDVDEGALRQRIDADPNDGEAHLKLGRLHAARRDYDTAIEHLLAAVRAGGDHKEPAREQLLGVFNILGDADPRVREARPKLASALF